MKVAVRNLSQLSMRQVFPHIAATMLFHTLLLFFLFTFVSLLSDCQVYLMGVWLVSNKKFIYLLMQIKPRMLILFKAYLDRKPHITGRNTLVTDL